MPSSLSQGVKLFAVHWNAPAAAFQTDLVVFTAPFDCVLQSANEVHAVLGTDGSAVNIQLTRDTGTQAPGAGTDLLANNSNAGFNMKAAVNTPQYATFKNGASRRFARGDRLSLDFAGTHTAVAGTAITAVFNRLD